jgi:hypothetical protein
MNSKLIAAAATWGRVAEREGYSKFGLPAGNGSSFGSGPCIIEKSALLQRLIAGKEPLTYRPPTSNSYPWYEVIESIQSEHQVFIGDSLSLGSMMSPGANPGERCISINGALWRIEETICPDQEYIVSWGQYPMKWKLTHKLENKGTIEEVAESLKIANSDFVLGIVCTFAFHALLGHSDSIALNSTKSFIDGGKKKYEGTSEESIRKNIKYEIDENDICWEKTWALQRIGLSGWPYAGEVLDVTQKEFISITKDSHGDTVLFRADGETESNDPSGEASIRIEHDVETNTSRYISMYVSARSKLERKIQDECGNFLESLLDLAMSREGAIFVMDRSESSKEILRLFRTKARPDTKY